jgi:hypothetical protein
MSCKRCASDYLKEFSGELAIHFPGRDGLTKPIMWIFPNLTTCLDCGFVEFMLPDEEREQLRHDDCSAQSRGS